MIREAEGRKKEEKTVKRGTTARPPKGKGKFFSPTEKGANPSRAAAGSPGMTHSLPGGAELGWPPARSF